jgi:hypothetical protein
MLKEENGLLQVHLRGVFEGVHGFSHVTIRRGHAGNYSSSAVATQGVLQQ